MDRLKNARLIDFVEEYALQYGNFELSNGSMSNYFVDMSKVTTRSDSLDLITQTILHWLEYEVDWPCHAVGGPVLGATPLIYGLVQAYQYYFHGMGLLRGFMVRKEPKNGILIEGDLRSGDNVLILEDVVTTGAQTKRAVDTVEAAGGKVRGIVAVVDRLAGAKQLLGDRFRSMMTIEDLKVVLN